MQLRLLIFTVIFLKIGLVNSAIAALPPVVFTTISSIEGLPQNTGRAMLQDHEGFIWVGTEDGLVRFDGHSMLSFRKNYDNPKTLSDNYIDSLEEDKAGRIWVGTMGGGLNVIDKNRRYVSRIKDLSTEDIRDIIADPDGERLWLATGGGLYLLELHQQQDEPLQLNKIVVSPVQLSDGTGGFFHKTISGIVLAGNYLWFCTREDGVGRYDLQTRETGWFYKGEHGLATDTFNTIFKDSSGNVWLGSQDRGLVKVVSDGEDITFKHYDSATSGLSSDDVMAIEDAGGGKLWLGTWSGGLALFDSKSGSVEHYRNQVTDQYSIPSDIIMSIIRTDNDQIWLGTFDKGVSWFHPNSPFHTYRADLFDRNKLQSNLIWSFAPEKEKALWVGTGKGVGRLDLASNEFDTPEDVQPKSLWQRAKNDDIRALMLDDDVLWIAGRKEGVHKLSLSKKMVTPLDDLLADKQSLTHQYVRIIYKDSSGIIWFGASKGLNRFDPEKGIIRNYMPSKDIPLSLPHYRIRSIYEDSAHRIWVGTSNGLVEIDESGDVLQVVLQGASKDGLHLSGKGVRGMGEDEHGRLWLATEGGISVYDREAKTTVILRENRGLPNNAVYSVIAADGFMWSTTLNGLARINLETFEVVAYFADDGLPDNEFNFNAWQKLPGGGLALGTLSGFALVSPQKIPGPEKTGYVPPLYVTPFLYHEDGKRYSTELAGDTIKVDWMTNKISFSYGALNYSGEKAVSYELKLTGAEESWSSSEGLHFSTFTGLAAGNYTFNVRAKDNHGQWVVESPPINFTIAPAPWKTGFAFILYLALAIVVLALCTALYNRRLQKRSNYLEGLVAKRTVALENSNLQLTESHHQLDSLMASRERFFRAIAHELRTPLTLILSLLESYRHGGVEESKVMPLIEQRARRIDTLLDSVLNLASKTTLSRAESVSFNLARVLEKAILPYQQQADLEDKQLAVHLAVEDIFLTMDQETFMIVVSGLLANAFKYTKGNGQIEFTASLIEGYVQISIADDGIGIDAADASRIFNWFERAAGDVTDNGWGIGLAFARDEVEFAGGTLRLGQDREKGAEFVVTLPLPVHIDKLAKVQDSEVAAEIIEAQHPILLDSQRCFTLLIVEDDSDLLEHLPTLFPEHWVVLTALDAERGGELACSQEPDIIITDLMLPGESGFDLTRKLKNDPETAHIPIIILTAMNTEAHRLEGLGLSADSFLGKPFKNIELQLRVAGLLENRLNVVQRAQQIVLGHPIAGEVFEHDESKENSPHEDLFFEKLQENLGSNHEIATMTLDLAAKKMAMSKRSLQREMEKIGVNWSEYKRLRKIRYAMELLQNTNNNIGDIAELAGYNSAAHFGKAFKELTGKSPSVWRKANK